MNGHLHKWIHAQVCAPTLASYWHLTKQLVSVLQTTVAPVEGRLRHSVPSLPAIKPDRLKAAKSLVEKAVKVKGDIITSSSLTIPWCAVSYLTRPVSLLLFSWRKFFLSRDPIPSSVLPYGPEGGWNVGCSILSTEELIAMAMRRRMLRRATSALVRQWLWGGQSPTRSIKSDIRTERDKVSEHERRIRFNCQYQSHWLIGWYFPLIVKALH